MAAHDSDPPFLDIGLGDGLAELWGDVVEGDAFFGWELNVEVVCDGVAGRGGRARLTVGEDADRVAGAGFEVFGVGVGGEVNTCILYVCVCVVSVVVVVGVEDMILFWWGGIFVR